MPKQAGRTACLGSVAPDLLMRQANLHTEGRNVPATMRGRLEHWVTVEVKTLSGERIVYAQRGSNRDNATERALAAAIRSHSMGPDGDQLRMTVGVVRATYHKATVTSEPVTHWGTGQDITDAAQHLSDAWRWRVPYGIA
jgi:predicted small secreted protein